MNVLFRADASVAMGTGHVMRCLALAQAVQDCGGRVAFLMADSTPAILTRLATEQMDVLSVASPPGTADDASQTIDLARQRDAEWIVLDGYQFSAEYQRALKSAAFKTLVIDDYGHAQHYSADLVLNQNVGADEGLYRSRDALTRLLLGPRYCLLRREFSRWRAWKREVSPVGCRVLVTMGGSDPEDLTSRAISALGFLRNTALEAVVVIGGSTPKAEPLERLASSVGEKIRVRRNVTNMAELMAWADVAVSSSGSTCWELCLLGLPALLVDAADNQTAVARELHRRGCAIHLGGARDLTAEQIARQLQALLGSEESRSEISRRCRALVDGEGALRVIAAMSRGLRLRPAQEGDSRLLWDWANDPQVRSAAFSSEPIPWEQHQVWFASKMKDPDCRILVAEDEGGKAVGQFRVDWRSANDGEIDVSVSSECRGSGYGSRLIDLGSGMTLAERGGRLHAYVKVENRSSRRAFEQAGFTCLGEERVHDQAAIHYVRGNYVKNMGSK